MSAIAAAPTTPATTQPYRLRWAVLAIVLVAEVMDLVDGTIVNVAAPSIRADLGGSATTLQWLGAAYTLAFAVLLITGGRLGDRYGRRRLFLTGIVGFTAASALCAAAPSPGVLITLRAVQGTFGALLIPQGFGMIKQVFAEHEVTKAFAAFGPVIGLAAVCFFAAMIGLNLVLSLFCQLGEGFSPLRTGLTLAPFAIGVALTAPASYPLAQRFGRVAMQAGFAVMAAGLVLLAVMVEAAGGGVSSWTLVPGELVAGMGMGIALPPLFDFILAGVADHEVGSASGVLNAVQQLGAALGIAVLATIFFAYLDHDRLPADAMTSTTLLSIVPLGLAYLASWRLPRRARAEGGH